jgi:hypothetical protein
MLGTTYPTIVMYWMDKTVSAYHKQGLTSFTPFGIRLDFQTSIKIIDLRRKFNPRGINFLLRRKEDCNEVQLGDHLLVQRGVKASHWSIEGHAGWVQNDMALGSGGYI